MPADRRMRSCLTAPIRAERACRRVLSSAFLRLSRAIAPGTPHHPHSPQPPSRTLHASNASSAHEPPAQSTSGTNPSLSAHNSNIQPVDTPFGPETTYQPIARAGASHTDTPPYPASSLYVSAHYAHSTATPLPVPNASALQTPTPSPPPPASPAFTNPNDAPPSPPAYAAAHTPPLYPPANYEMTPQGGSAALPSPPSGRPAHPTTFQAPSSIAWTPQQRGYALAAFVPSPSLAHRRLRAVTPEVISPRTALGEMGIAVFYNPDEVGTPALSATRTPRASPRASPYMRGSPQRRRARRVVSLPLISGGNAVASGSRLAPLATSQVEDERMSVDAPESPAATPRAPARVSHGLPDALESDSFDSQNPAQGLSTTPIASTTTPSALPLMVSSPPADATPPVAPTLAVRNLPDTPSGRHFVIPQDTSGSEDQQGGALELVVEDGDVAAGDEVFDDAEVEDVEGVSIEEETDEFIESDGALDEEAEGGGPVELDASPPASPEEPQETLADVLHDLQRLAQRMDLPQPPNATGQAMVDNIDTTVVKLREELNDALEVASTVQQQLETLRGEYLALPAIQQALTHAINDLKRSTTKSAPSHTTHTPNLNAAHVL